MEFSPKIVSKDLWRHGPTLQTGAGIIVEMWVTWVWITIAQSCPSILWPLILPAIGIILYLGFGRQSSCPRISIFFIYWHWFCPRGKDSLYLRNDPAREIMNFLPSIPDWLASMDILFYLAPKEFFSRKSLQTPFHWLNNKILWLNFS